MSNKQVYLLTDIDSDEDKFHNCLFVTGEGTFLDNRRNDDGEIVGHTLVFKVYDKKAGLYVETDDKSLRQQLAKAANFFLDRNEGCLCIHVRTLEGNPNQVSIVLHGFVSTLPDPNQLNFLKCELTLSITRRRIETTETLTIEGEVDLSSPRGQVSDIPAGQTGDHCETCRDIFGCDNDEDFFESLSKLSFSNSVEYCV